MKLPQLRFGQLWSVKESISRAHVSCRLSGRNPVACSIALAEMNQAVWLPFASS